MRVEGARHARGSGHCRVTSEPRLVGGEGVSHGQVSGGISDLRQGLSFHKLWLRDLGQLTNCCVSSHSPCFRGAS